MNRGTYALFSGTEIYIAVTNALLSYSYLIEI